LVDLEGMDDCRVLRGSSTMGTRVEEEAAERLTLLTSSSSSSASFLPSVMLTVS
jgi:hypothetical protein